MKRSSDIIVTPAQLNKVSVIYDMKVSVISVGDFIPKRLPIKPYLLDFEKVYNSVLNSKSSSCNWAGLKKNLMNLFRWRNAFGLK